MLNQSVGLAVENKLCAVKKLDVARRPKHGDKEENSHRANVTGTNQCNGSTFLARTGSPYIIVQKRGTFACMSLN
jgi:hypothetical protein